MNQKDIDQCISYLKEINCFYTVSRYETYFICKIGSVTDAFAEFDKSTSILSFYKADEVTNRVRF